eukprot:gene14045-15505_t
MALLTIERSPSVEKLLSSSSEDEESENESSADESNVDLFNEELAASMPGSKPPKLGRLRSPSFAGYFASKGGAVSIPDGSMARTPSPIHTTSCGELQLHLQAMITLMREHDVMKMAVRIESQLPDKKRYLTLVASSNEESLLIGIDWVHGPTIGLVLELPSSTVAKLDGDGGFHVSLSSQRTFCFKPVSVQTLWSAMHVIQRGIDNSAKHTIENENYRDFVSFYQNKITSDPTSISEWNMMDNLLSTRQFDLVLSETEESEQAAIKKLIKPKLKEVMCRVDLDNVTSRQIRRMCEDELEMDLSEFKSYLDDEMFMILGQMDSASTIFDYLYLGSEWNASNFDELKRLGIGYILNLTKEIDNFFPDSFHYFNVRVYDEEDTQLLPYWEHTYKFINNARLAGSRVLVHCRRGISRSASSVIAYVMKLKKWSLTESMDYVKKCRSIVEPNAGFERQLIIYEGILNSSRNRYNALFRQRSKSERQMSSIKEKRRMFKSRRSKDVSDEQSGVTQISEENEQEDEKEEDSVLDRKRPKSWSIESSDSNIGVIPPTDSTMPSLMEVASNDTHASEEQQSLGELPSRGESPLNDEPTNEIKKKKLDEVDGGRPRRMRRPMKRPRTLPCQSTMHWEIAREDDEEPMVKENVGEEESKNEELVEQAMTALVMKTQLLRSLVQLQEEKGTRTMLDNEFSVESIVRPSSLRKISHSGRLRFERTRSFSEDTEVDVKEKKKLRKRAMTVSASKHFKYVNDEDRDGAGNDNKDKLVDDDNEDTVGFDNQDKVGCDIKDKVDDDSKEKVDGDNEDKVDGDNEDKVDGDNEDKVDGDNEDKVDGDNEDKVDGDNEDKVDGDNEDKVDGDNEDKVDGDNEDKVDGDNEDNVDGDNEDKVIDVNEDKVVDVNEDKFVDDNKDKVVDDNKDKAVGDNEDKFLDDDNNAYTPLTEDEGTDSLNVEVTVEAYLEQANYEADKDNDIEAKDESNAEEPAEETTVIHPDSCVIKTSQFKTVKAAAQEFEEKQRLCRERLARKPRRHTVGGCEIHREMKRGPRKRETETRSKSSDGRKVTRGSSTSPVCSFELSSANDNEEEVVKDNSSNQSETVQCKDESITPFGHVVEDRGNNEDLSVRDLVEKHKKLIHGNSSPSNEFEDSQLSGLTSDSVTNEMISHSDTPEIDQTMDSTDIKNDVNDNIKPDDNYHANVKDTVVVKPGIVKRQSLLLAKAFNHESGQNEPEPNNIPGPDCMEKHPESSSESPEFKQRPVNY